MRESVKRTAELKSFADYGFQSSASRTLVQIARSPSAEALGYFHSVRFADVKMTFAAKPSFGNSQEAILNQAPDETKLAMIRNLPW